MNSKVISTSRRRVMLRCTSSLGMSCCRLHISYITSSSFRAWDDHKQLNSNVCAALKHVSTLACMGSRLLRLRPRVKYRSTHSSLQYLFIPLPPPTHTTLSFVLTDIQPLLDNTYTPRVQYLASHQHEGDPLSPGCRAACPVSWRPGQWPHLFKDTMY